MRLQLFLRIMLADVGTRYCCIRGEHDSFSQRPVNRRVDGRRHHYDRPHKWSSTQVE